MKEIKNLSNEEYGGLPFSFQDILKIQVNKEAIKQQGFSNDGKLFEAKPIPREKLSAGLINFLMQLRP